MYVCANILLVCTNGEYDIMKMYINKAGQFCFTRSVEE